MSAIVAAMVDTAHLVNILRTLADLDSPVASALADRHEQRLTAAGRAIVDASNAACRAGVIRKAPRTWAIRWSPPLWPAPDGEWLARDGQLWILATVRQPRADLRPCWTGTHWVWGSPAHGPRTCA